VACVHLGYGLDYLQGHGSPNAPSSRVETLHYESIRVLAHLALASRLRISSMQAASRLLEVQAPGLPVDFGTACPSTAFLPGLRRPNPGVKMGDSDVGPAPIQDCCAWLLHRAQTCSARLQIPTPPEPNLTARSWVRLGPGFQHWEQRTGAFTYLTRIRPPRLQSLASVLGPAAVEIRPAYAVRISTLNRICLSPAT
jgi:hypothetical protein